MLNIGFIEVHVRNINPKFWMNFGSTTHLSFPPKQIFIL